MLDVTHVCGQVFLASKLFLNDTKYTRIFFCWICFCCSIIYQYVYIYSYDCLPCSLTFHEIVLWTEIILPPPKLNKCVRAAYFAEKSCSILHMFIFAELEHGPLRYKKIGCSLGLNFVGKVVRHPLHEACLLSSGQCTRICLSSLLH